MKRHLGWGVLFLLVFAPVLCASGTQEPPREETVFFSSEDGLNLHGTLTGSGKDFVILSNQHHSTEITWSTLTADLAQAGWSVLTYDYRGIGKSQGPESVPDVDRDLRAAHQFALSRGARRIALVGASLGSIVTLKLTAELHPVGAVFLSVSPGFLGMNLSSEPAEGVNAPLLFITSEYDFANEDTRNVAALFPQDELLVVPASDHGTGLPDGPYGDEVRAKVVAFLKAHLR